MRTRKTSTTIGDWRSVSKNLRRLAISVSFASLSSIFFDFGDDRHIDPASTDSTSRNFNTVSQDAGTQNYSNMHNELFVTASNGKVIATATGERAIEDLIERIPERGVEQDDGNLIGIIQDKCADEKIDTDIAIKMAWVESTMRSDAANGKSGARGLFQFTWPTFKEYLHKYADELGFPEVANMVVLEKHRNDDGTYDFEYKTAEGYSQDDVFKHAFNPELNAALACRKMALDAERIRQDIGIEPDAADMRATHMLGTSGGLEFLKLYHMHDFHHHAPSDYFSAHAINRNRSIFFHRGGEGPERSIAQVRDYFTKQMSKSAQEIKAAYNDMRQKEVANRLPRHIPPHIREMRRQNSHTLN